MGLGMSVSYGMCLGVWSLTQILGYGDSNKKFLKKEHDYQDTT